MEGWKESGIKGERVPLLISGSESEEEETDADGGKGGVSLTETKTAEESPPSTGSKEGYRKRETEDSGDSLVVDRGAQR